MALEMQTGEVTFERKLSASRDGRAAGAPPGATAGATGATPLLDLVRRFTFPRFPGTEGERRAADLVAAEFTAAGLHVTREPFEASRRAIFWIRFALHGAGALLTMALGWWASESPALASACGAALLFMFASSVKWPRLFEKLFDLPGRVASENVIGRVPPRAGHLAAGAAATSSRTRPALQLVFLAHLDSKSSRDPTFVPVALLLGAMLIVFVLFVRAALAAVGLATAPPALLTFPLGCIAAIALLRAMANPSGNASPGAMDNASGLAVLVDAARRLPADSALAGAELVFLATGAEEIGLCGALRWIQAHGAECDRGSTAFLNVDSVGVGRGLFALDVHGLAPDGRKMAQVVRAAGAASGVTTRVLAALPGVGVDTMPIAARGFATVTVLGQVLGGASRRIHTERDTPEALGEEGMRDAQRFVHELARQLAGGTVVREPVGERVRRPAVAIDSV